MSIWRVLLNGRNFWLELDGHAGEVVEVTGVDADAPVKGFVFYKEADS